MQWHTLVDAQNITLTKELAGTTSSNLCILEYCTTYTILEMARQSQIFITLQRKRTQRIVINPKLENLCVQKYQIVIE